MSSKTLVSNIDKKIAALEALLKQLHLVREAVQTEAFAEVFDFCEQVESAKKEASPAARKSASAQNRKCTKFGSVRQFFLSRDNAWSRSGEIAEATRLPSKVLRQMIYSRYVDRFERRDDPENPARKQFRLTEESLANHL